MSATSESQPLSVVLNRERLNDVIVPAEFTTEGPFHVRFENEGAPIHVHVRPEGQLADVVSIVESNQYVEREAQQMLPVNVAELDGPVSGTLSVITGHGSETEEVAVTVEPPSESPPPDPTPDERGPSDAEPTQPSPEPRRPEPSDGLLADPAELLVAGLAALAVLLAVIVQTTIGSPVVTLGVVAMLAAVAIAVWILLRE